MEIIVIFISFDQTMGVPLKQLYLLCTALSLITSVNTASSHIDLPRCLVVFVSIHNGGMQNRPSSIRHSWRSRSLQLHPKSLSSLPSGQFGFPSQYTLIGKHRSFFSEHRLIIDLLPTKGYVKHEASQSSSDAS